MSNSADVNVVLPLLAAIERGITGVKRAFDNAPDSLNGTDMPLFVNLPGAMISEVVGTDEFAVETLETREYSAVLIIAPYGTGVSGEKFRNLTTWFAKVRNAFEQYQGMVTPILDGDGDVVTPAANALRLQFRGDTGARPDIIYGGMQYYGIRFTISVTGRARVRLASGE